MTLNSPNDPNVLSPDAAGSLGPLSEDAFLGGKLHLLQPEGGYRAGIDAVLLAASVPALAGQTALELGCGTGVAVLCLRARVPDLVVSGVEVQPGYAALARINARRNNLPLRVEEGDLSAMPTVLRQERFNHVLANPPYFLRRNGPSAKDTAREGALGEVTRLDVWIDTAARRLLPGGTFSLIQRSERFLDVVQGLDRRFGAVQILPIASREGRAAKLFLLRARKGRKSPPKLLAPMVLHDGPMHLRDGDSFSAPAAGILRRGEPLRGFSD